jgi:hypothetical protein
MMMGARDGGVVDELQGVPCAERCQKSLQGLHHMHNALNEEGNMQF